jgi:transposase
VRSHRRSEFARESGMIPAGKWMAASEGGSWSLQQSGVVCLMHIGFLVFDPLRKCAGCSAIRMHALSLLFGAQKNDLRGMRTKHSGWYDRKVRRARDLPAAGSRIFLEFEVRRVGCRQCGKVKRERLEFLADNPLYTKRFAFYVGRRCRSSPIRDVAQELKLDWHTVKELDKQYMRAQLAKAGTPAPTVIGIDEISVRKGHEYRIVVSDLIRGRPIWFGGDDRSEASMAQFYQSLGKKRGRIRLAVMDMWKPFRNAANAYAPQAAILFDKFHVIRHLGEALDQVRKSEYARLSRKQRRFIKGQKYTPLSRKENLTLEGRQALRTLLRANKRLNQQAKRDLFEAVQTKLGANAVARKVRLRGSASILAGRILMTAATA